MNKSTLRTLLLVSGTLALGCDKQGLHPYGKLTDIVESCGANASVYLRTTDADPNSGTPATDMVLIGSVDPTAPVSASSPRCFIYGTVQQDSSTILQYGTYDLDASGHGTAYVVATYLFTYEASAPVAARSGASRTDYMEAYAQPLIIAPSGNDLSISIEVSPGNPVQHTYRSLEDVIAAIQPGVRPDADVVHDTYQLYNLALFFSQVRIPAFGGLGMTRYITAPGNFQGLASGNYTVSVESLTNPTATINYNMLEDFPGVLVDGPQITKVNISGDGPMEGVLHWQFRRPGAPLDVLLSGTVDYAHIGVQNGIGATGYYDVVIDPVAPSTTPITGQVPVSVASNVDITGLLPVSP